MSHRGARGAKGILGAAMGLIMIAVVAVGGLIGYRVLSADDGGGDRTKTVSAAQTPGPTIAAPPSLPTPPTKAPTSAAPSTSASRSASPSETGPGSRTGDPALQAAADKAVADSNAALVAIDMRNGEIVALTNQATSLSGNIAPGSTFKIVSSALLLQKGAVTPGSKVPCPKNAVAGKQWENMHDYENAAATFKEDFAMSCNTAFVELRGKIGNDELSAFSTRYFGLNSNAWKVKTGLGTTDGVVPKAVDDADKAAQLIGQSTLKMNPMTMASVVATAVTGEFHQPILERGMPVHKTSAKLPSNVSKAIKDMMVACATTGTAKSNFAGMSGVGAKTGTAEVGNSTNGWMVAFRGNIAVAVVVEGGASGSSAAGPVVRSFLSAVPATR